MTRLCAEAMGFKEAYSIHEYEGVLVYCPPPHGEIKVEYNPLFNDAQAMALVKRFGLWLMQDELTTKWWARTKSGDVDCRYSMAHDSLNLAVVQCVAWRQSDKRKA